MQKERKSQAEDSEKTEDFVIEVESPAEEETEQPTVALPQNIRYVGKTDEHSRKVYISQGVYRKIHKFAADKRSVECGGVLVGEAIEAFEKQHIVIRGFIEAKHSKGTATSLTFTHESWEYIYQVREKAFPDLKIIGWIHTHPDHGIFLSDHDLFIQKNFFSEPYQIAYVVDPIREEEGFFLNQGEEAERISGFYLYDAVGKEIKLPKTASEKQPESPVSDSKKHTVLLSALTALLICCNVFGGIALANLTQMVHKQQQNISETEQRQQELLDTVTRQEQAIADLRQQIPVATSTAVPIATDVTENNVE